MVRVALLAVNLVACLACAANRRAGHEASSDSFPTNLSGLWEGMSRTISQVDGPTVGDARLERQAWSLIQRDDAITGFYVVELTMLSGDGRLYLCTHAPRLHVIVRVDVRGRIRANQADLEEIGEPRSKGPCPLGQRPTRKFHAVIRGNLMTLAHDGQPMILVRKSGADAKQAEALLALAPSESDGAIQTADRPPPFERRALTAEDDGRNADADGFWMWENNSITPDGDERSEREEWHLVQEGDKIAGHYDRWVRQVSTDGHPYRCSGNLDFRIGIRYDVTGEVRGGTIAVYERHFEVLEGGPCEPGSRRLDAYHGRIADDEIRLMVGTGVQVLRRGRPDVPSQRF
jgi:hypothetical protein